MTGWPGQRHVGLAPKAAIEADMQIGRNVPILLQKSLAIFVNSDSVALMRFAMEAIDDGAAQSRSGRVFLFIPP
jgi:hypothetical protein